MVETNKGIKRLIEDGEIVMHPRDDARINNGSVDVSIGRYIARLKPDYAGYMGMGAQWCNGLHTMKLNQIIGAEAFDIEDLLGEDDDEHRYQKIPVEKGIIRLRAHERILAHTQEFIGSRVRSIPEMRAKSSSARWGFTVCACAGWGDVGYYNRWTMEIFNYNPCPIEIELGTLVAQIVFHSVEVPEEGTFYNQGAEAYQRSDDLQKLIQSWKPEDMLPKKMKSIGYIDLDKIAL